METEKGLSDIVNEVEEQELYDYFKKHYKNVKSWSMPKKQFLYDYQMDAVKKMSNGCILNGGVGSGKSRTGLYY